MNDGLSPEMVLTVVKRLTWIVMWVTFAVFHLALLVAGLFLLWALAVPPQRVSAWLLALRDSQPTLWLLFFGVSAATGLALYLMLWRRIFVSLTTPFLLREFGPD